MSSGTPAFCAFATFEPGLSPTKTPVVIFETLSLTFGKIDFTYKLVKDDSDYYTRKPVREKVPERSW